MDLSGSCYCGALTYTSSGDPVLKAQCHCRECQYFSGGGVNYFMILPMAGFTYTAGTPKQFTRTDLDAPVTRDFCAECGTHVLTQTPTQPGMAILKVGTLDDPSVFTAPKIAIYTVDQQPFHIIPDGMPSFERVPQR
ncbi:MAG: GFA family protein [Sedimentitalea sp.]